MKRLVLFALAAGMLVPGSGLGAGKKKKGPPKGTAPAASQPIPGLEDDIVFLSMQSTEVDMSYQGGVFNLSGGTGRARGSGFIVQSGDAQYLYTNVHNLTGATEVSCETMNGTKFNDFSSLEVSGDPSIPDVARLKLSNPRPMPLQFPPPDFKPQIGGPVTAYGDSGGQRAVTRLEGKMVAIGPAEIESTVGFIQGNSGGPLILSLHGTVVGINTMIRWTKQEARVLKGTRFEGGRRFSYRADKVSSWRVVDFNRLVAERAKLDAINRGTWAVSLLAQAELTPSRTGFKLHDPKAEAERQKSLKEKIGAAGDAHDPLVRRVLDGIAEVDSKLHAATTVKGGVKPPVGLTPPQQPSKPGAPVAGHVAKQVYLSFFNSVIRGAEAGFKDLNEKTLTPYHYAKLQEATEVRERVLKAVKERMATLEGTQWDE